MASRAGLFDFEFEKKAIFDPEMNSDGIFDPDFSQTAVTSLTAAQEIGIFDQQASSQMVGLVWV